MCKWRLSCFCFHYFIFGTEGWGGRGCKMSICNILTQFLQPFTKSKKILYYGVMVHSFRTLVCRRALWNCLQTSMFFSCCFLHFNVFEMNQMPPSFLQSVISLRKSLSFLFCFLYPNPQILIYRTHLVSSPTCSMIVQ